MRLTVYSIVLLLLSMTFAIERTAPTLLSATQTQETTDSTVEEELPVKEFDFESGDPGEAPISWIVMGARSEYSIAVSDEQPKVGLKCAVLEIDEKPKAAPFGSLSRVLDAKPYRGKRIRFRAAMRAVVPDGDNKVQLWFRVDCKDSPGTFDNMSDRPVTSDEWDYYEIVGDVADDALKLHIGMILHGEGKAYLDDVSIEVVDEEVAATAKLRRKRPAARRAAAADMVRRRRTPLDDISPGLFEIVGSSEIRPSRFRKDGDDDESDEAFLLLPLPLSYRDQVPLTYEITSDPPDAIKTVIIKEDQPKNFVAEVTLKDLSEHEKIKLKFQSIVLVRPSSFDDVPETAEIPDVWPAETQPWLQSTWCVGSDDERIQKVAASVCANTNDVLQIIKNAEEKAKQIMRAQSGRGENLTAVEALDHQGSCTSCGNLMAAILRASNVPTRILSGYPSWSGPLQTHYMVESYVPGYGWYPVESTMCKSPWPNQYQVNVAIIPPEYESEELAGRRPSGAGGVPYLSLTETPNNRDRRFSSWGTIEGAKGCDHECVMIREIDGDDKDWEKAFEWARPRWEEFISSELAAADGAIKFEMKAADFKLDLLKGVWRK